MPLVDAEELDPDGLVLAPLTAGAPHTVIEKVHGDREAPSLRAALESHAGRPCVGVLPMQLGPVNALMPLIVAAQLGLPCLDVDGMRRTFPKLEMTLFALAGVPISPVILVDAVGSLAVVSAADDDMASSLFRSCLPSMGLVAMCSAYLLDVRQCALIGSKKALTRCAELGAALRAVRPGAAENYRAFLDVCGGRIVFSGVVLEVVQYLDEGFAKGTLSLADGDRSMRIDFQGENLVATEDGVPLVTVPDLINLIDIDTGGIERSVDVVVGQHVHVIASPVDPRWHTAEGHARVGPARVRHRPRLRAGRDVRVGLAVGGALDAGVVLDAEDEVLARCAVPGEGGLAHRVAALFDALGDAVEPAAIDRVVLATSLTRPLYRPKACALVGVLRIGAPAGNSVPPFTRWPADLTAVVRGPVSMVAGGHDYDGREAAALDAGAVEAFAQRCRGVARAVAVTAINAQANRAHEERAARILGDVLGPDIPVVTGGDEGGLGLLERENAAVLDATLSPAAHRALDEVFAVMAARGMPDELYLLRGDGTVFPAQSAARRPFRTAGALHSSARTGGVHLAGESTVVVVDDDGRGLRVSSSVDGWPQESGRLVEVLGIRTNLRELRVTAVPPESRSDMLERAVAGLDAPVVLVRGAARLPDYVLPDRVLRPADADYAAAIGAAVGEAAGSTDRIFWLGERTRTEVIAEARQLAEQSAVRAGADPRRLRVGAVHETLMTYVPASCIAMRVRAVGPVLSARTVTTG